MSKIKTTEVSSWNEPHLFSSPSRRWHQTACLGLYSSSQSRPSLNWSVQSIINTSVACKSVLTTQVAW